MQPGTNSPRQWAKVGNPSGFARVLIAVNGQDPLRRYALGLSDCAYGLEHETVQQLPTNPRGIGVGEFEGFVKLGNT